MSEVTDINHPDWKPGKGMLRKAQRRADQTGCSFEMALAWVIGDSKARSALARAHEARMVEEARPLREEVRADRRAAFPAPSSVHAVPTAIETNRRAH